METVEKDVFIEKLSFSVSKAVKVGSFVRLLSKSIDHGQELSEPDRLFVLDETVVHGVD
jgi:hypothetical protein